MRHVPAKRVGAALIAQSVRFNQPTCIAYKYLLHALQGVVFIGWGYAVSCSAAV